MVIMKCDGFSGRVARCVWIASVICFAGCRSAPTLPDVAGIDLNWSAYQGTTLGAPATQPADRVEGWLVHTVLVVVDRDPGQVLQPLSARGRLFAQAQQGDPIAASASVTRGVRIGVDAEADLFASRLFDGQFGPTAMLSDQSAVLSSGVTLEVAADKASRGIELRLHRRADDRMELLVIVEQEADRTIEAGEPAAGIIRESVLVDDLALNVAHPIVLILPTRWAGSKTKAIIALFEIAMPSSDHTYLDAQARTTDLLTRSAARAAARPTELPVTNDAWGGYELALRRSDAPGKRRSALNYVAAQTGSTIAHDIIVTGDESTLGQYTALLLRSMAASNLPREPSLLGWLMDRAALELCVTLSAAAPLSPELASVLTIHGGEAGRNTASLGDLIKDVRNRDDLQTRLTVENLIYLEDSSPAARVRAFDWLSARGKAPAGYDPLGPLQQRRAALEQSQTPATAPAGANP